MGSERGDEYKRPCPLGEGTDSKEPADSEAPQRATASRLVPTHQAMDRGEGDQRLWFVVDELDALGEIDGLKDALARLRKFGAEPSSVFSRSLRYLAHTVRPRRIRSLRTAATR